MSKLSHLSCGDCADIRITTDVLKRNPHHDADRQICGDVKLPESRICPKFKPDIFVLDESQRQVIRQLSNMVKKLDEKALRCVAGALLKEERTRKTGLRFGQQIYVRWRSYANRNYLNNFMLAYVVDAVDGKLRLMSEDGATTLTYDFPTSFEGPTFYTAKAFRPLYRQMKDKQAYTDPKVLEASIRKTDPEEDVRKLNPKGKTVPTTDQALRGKKRKRRLTTSDANLNDICNIVADIEAGRHIGHIMDDGEDEVHVLSSDNYKRRSNRDRRGSGSGETELGSLIQSGDDE